jgi:hypothetical protein
MFCPRSEVSELTIISVIGKPHLWAYEQDLPVVCNDTTVINHVLVYNWPFVGVFSKTPAKGQQAAHMPISQTMSMDASEVKILASTSQEWRTVSPIPAFTRRKTSRKS